MPRMNSDDWNDFTAYLILRAQRDISVRLSLMLIMRYLRDFSEEIGTVVPKQEERVSNTLGDLHKRIINEMRR